MRAAALTQRQRRGDDTTHVYVVGGMRLIGNAITLAAVEQGPALNIIRPIQLTPDARRMYRWRTKQAASQFIDRHTLADLHVFNLAWLDILHAGDLPAGQLS